MKLRRPNNELRFKVLSVCGEWADCLQAELALKRVEQELSGGIMTVTSGETRDSSESVKEGVKLARGIFALRGNHTEAHLTETELAAALTLAFQHGVRAAIQRLRPLAEGTL